MNTEPITAHQSDFFPILTRHYDWAFPEISCITPDWGCNGISRAILNLRCCFILFPSSSYKIIISLKVFENRYGDFYCEDENSSLTFLKIIALYMFFIFPGGNDNTFQNVCLGRDHNIIKIKDFVMIYYLHF